MAKAMPRGMKEQPSKPTFGPQTDEYAGRAVYNIHGHPGSGKTFAALQASAFWPEDLEAHEASGETIYLDDVVYIEWDRGGALGILPYGIRLKYHVSMADLVFEKGDLVDSIEKMSNDLYELVKEDHNIKYVIHDTVSRMDSMIESYCFEPKNICRTREGDEDGQRTYGKVAGIHHQYQRSFITLPDRLTNIFLFHQKVMEDRKKEPEGKKRKDLILKMGDQTIRVVPGITGKAANVYLADCSVEFVCQAIGVKDNLKRWLYSATVEGQRAKNRLQGVFDTREPAHMGKIIAKARKACS